MYCFQDCYNDYFWEYGLDISMDKEQDLEFKLYREVIKSKKHVEKESKVTEIYSSIEKLGSIYDEAFYISHAKYIIDTISSSDLYNGFGYETIIKYYYTIKPVDGEFIKICDYNLTGGYQPKEVKSPKAYIQYDINWFKQIKFSKYKGAEGQYV